MNLKRLLLILFSLTLNSNISSQELSIDHENRIYLEGEELSIRQAMSVSYDVSKRANAKFFLYQLSFSNYIISPIIGGTIIFNGIEKLNSIYPPGAYNQIIAGSLLSSSGIVATKKYRGRVLKDAVSAYNSDLPKYIEQKKLEEIQKTEEQKRLQEKIERDKQRKIKERAAEKNRLERFYAQLTERLTQSLKPLEGVYKSVDQGESFEYDIAILSSQKEENEYFAIVLAATDPTLKVGDVLFSLTATADMSLYFVEYQNKAGEVFTNKTAQLSGAILQMGVKSFVKMFPSENETRKFYDINPDLDWESSGSGVLINNQGYIATNNHVSAKAKQIRIIFQNDTIEYNARVVSQNENTDVAILKIEDERFNCELKPIEWQTKISLGQKVFTLGYPISNKMSDNVKVVDGIVSGMNGREGDPLYFQTTLPVWYGNSGGPCFNDRGEILGLATQILFDQGVKVDNVAYVTKSDNVLNLAGDIIQFSSTQNKSMSLEELIENLIPYSVFIKVNY